MSTLKVGAIRGVSASSDAVTVANDGTCTAKVTNNLSNRNIIINGAMQVAQRSAGPVAVSDGSNEAYQSIDRMHFSYGNSAAGAANISQATDAPTTLGFTKSHKTDVTTVNSTSSGNGVIGLKYAIEGQDLRSSGWNHLSASSFLTLSFYFKTTKTGNSKLPIMFRIFHGTAYYYVQNVTVTDPTNWNRYTVTIPGNSNLTINDLNTQAMGIFFSYQTGSDKDTGSEGAWGTTNAYSTSESTNYFDSTSNDMFITGIQLEVGEHATDFEHRSFAQELVLCKRYYRVLQDASGGACYMGAVGYNYDVNSVVIQVNFETEMRATPTLDNTSGTNYYRFYRNSGYVDINAFNAINGMNQYGGGFNNSDSGNGTAGQAGAVVLNNTAAKIAFDAEL
tara:strand:+ start:969 stop:2144 length:1176 start_codon:yes stop_codon:yes gene_type:complete